jgi:hypothetical protein
VSISASFVQTANAAAVLHLPLFTVVRGLFGLSTLAGLLMLFKPLLSGIGRALMLVIRPRQSKQQQQARCKMDDSLTMQQMINTSHGPSHTAELRAMAARH